jgi:peptide/nickel transport system permease protein
LRGPASVRLPPIARLIFRRLLMSMPLLLVVSALSFFLVSLIPGDPARQILGFNAAPGAYAQLRRSLGLDLPIYDQYWRWLLHALSGDLGTSLFTGASVTSTIDARLPVTLSLIIGSLVVSTVIGLSLGVFSALRGGAVGRSMDVFSLAGFSLPAFWVGAELIVVFAVKIHWFPAVGYVPPSQSVLGWLRSLVLPVLALSLGAVAAIAKQAREAMLDVLGSQYVHMARANGISARSIVLRHALKNAAPPVVTVVGVQAIALLGGTVLIETVFALPGLGSLVVSDTIDHDLPVVVGVALYFTAVVIVVNLVVDLMSIWLNPKIRA